MSIQHVEGAELAFVLDRSSNTMDMPETIVTDQDRRMLRDLGNRVAEVASLSVHAERARQWAGLNGLSADRPMVWLNDICWNEMNVDGELTLRTSSDFCRTIESELRRRLYWWTHMAGDMVVDATIDAPRIVHDSGYGLAVREETLSTEEGNLVVSHGFTKTIANEDDVEKLSTPVLTEDTARTAEVRHAYERIFEGVLEVGQRGYLGFAFSPWDLAVRFTGVQDALMGLAMEPELMHALAAKLTEIAQGVIDQIEAQNLFTLNNRNVRVGSGAYGYTDELPGDGYDPERVGAGNIWGFAAAQIFAEVSPDMHEEFALSYERKVLERFGLTYYGCCEPLHRKMSLIRTVPNLRKISASPWNDLERLAEHVGRDYVFSLKPNPEILARDRWDLETARKELEATLLSVLRHGCSVEIIMKDISTVRHEPQRLWEWTAMASEVAEKVASE